MDATFGHYINYTNIPDDSPNADPCNAETLPNPGGQGHTQILTKLIEENDEVYQYYVSRYIDSGQYHLQLRLYVGQVGQHDCRNSARNARQIGRWGGNIGTHQANVLALRNYIQARCVAIEDGLVDCYEVSGPYPTVFTVDPLPGGTLKVNSLTPSSYPYTGTHYGGIDILLKAFANPGYSFDYWESIEGDTINPRTSTDSSATIRIEGPDTIIAHFVQDQQC